MKKSVLQLRRDFIKSLMRQNPDGFFVDWDVADIEIEGTADEIHNFSTELARAGYYGRACYILEQGIAQYKLNTDLLADFLAYGVRCGQSHKCEEYFDRLNNISDRRKTWRAFRFAVDFLIYKISETDNDDEISSLKETALNIVERFKKVLPEEELAYLCEYEIYEATFDESTGLTKLEEFLNNDNRTAKVAPKCHLKYIDKMLQKGEYEKITLYANDGAAEAAQEQESVDTGYFFYALALAKDALWLKSEQKKDAIEKDEAAEILRCYQTAYDTLDSDKTAYFKVIEKRYRIIANYSGLAESSQLKERNRGTDNTMDLLQSIQSIVEQTLSL